MDITVSNDRGNLGEGDEAEGTGDPHRDVDQVEKGCCNRKTENTRVRSKQDTPSNEAQPNKGICHTLLNVFCCMCLLCCGRRYRWEETVLQDIGGRTSKMWYMCTLVRYWNGHTPKKLVHFQSASLKSTSDLQRTEELLICVKAPTNCPLDLNDATLATLNGLLKKLRGIPGIEPVHVRMPFTENVIGVYQPYHTNGSLKDLIYTSEGHTPNPNQVWGSKYKQSIKPLKAEKIALYGRQILETLLYLYEKGFPPLGHVTSGNVFVEGAGGTEVCRLGGYENTLLGYKTRLYKLFKKHPEHIDVLMFGHLLFEMAAGYELTTTAPEDGDFNSITTTDPNGEIENEDVIVMVLAAIFAPLLSESKVKKFFRKLPLVPQRKFPFLSIKEIASMKPFCDVELNSDWVIPKIDLSGEEEQLLGLVRGAIPFTTKAQGGPSAEV